MAVVAVLKDWWPQGWKAIVRPLQRCRGDVVGRTGE